MGRYGRLLMASMSLATVLCHLEALFTPALYPTRRNSPKEHPHFVWILWGSFVLTINAGFINTITLHTSLAMPSAHVTGPWPRP